ncbi:PDZ domain-containing protein [Patescibacteria group bacterium]|nr:PDZ domain-containing protein [Patescibacteria group bacterium]
MKTVKTVLVILIAVLSANCAVFGPNKAQKEATDPCSGVNDARVNYRYAALVKCTNQSAIERTLMKESDPRILFWGIPKVDRLSVICSVHDRVVRLIPAKTAAQRKVKISLLTQLTAQQKKIQKGFRLPQTAKIRDNDVRVGSDKATIQPSRPNKKVDPSRPTNSDGEELDVFVNGRRLSLTDIMWAWELANVAAPIEKAMIDVLLKRKDKESLKGPMLDFYDRLLAHCHGAASIEDLLGDTKKLLNEADRQKKELDEAVDILKDHGLAPPDLKATSDRPRKKLTELTNRNFKQKVLKSKLPVLVEFHADWCGPCKRFGPIVEELAETLDGHVNVYKLDADIMTEMDNRYNDEQRLPLLVVFKNGKPVGDIRGYMPFNRLAVEVDSLLRKKPVAGLQTVTTDPRKLKVTGKTLDGVSTDALDTTAELHKGKGWKAPPKPKANEPIFDFVRSGKLTAVLVKNVQKDNYAGRAGLGENDAIVSFNGTSVNSRGQIGPLSRALRGKDSLTLRVYRGGKGKPVDLRVR